MTRYYNAPPRARLNWTAIGGLCGVVVCLCAMVTVFGEFILPEIKARQQTSDDVNALKIQVSSISSDTKEHTRQNEEMHRDILDIKRALKIYDTYPATVMAMPATGLPGNSTTQ